MGVIVTKGRLPLVDINGRVLAAGAIAPDPPDLPSTSAYRYQPPSLPQSASDLIVVNSGTAGLDAANPGNWNKYLLLVGPPEPMSGKLRAMSMQCKGIFTIGQEWRQVGYSTNANNNGNTYPGGDIYRFDFQAGAPAGVRPFAWVSRVKFTPVNSYYGDFCDIGTKITGAFPAWNSQEHMDIFFQFIKMTNGHYTWTAPDGNKNSHSDMVQASIGGYRKIVFADCELYCSGNNIYYLSGGNFDRVKDGKAHGDKSSRCILDHVSFFSSTQAGFGDVPAQYLLQSGTFNQNGPKGSFTWVFGGTTMFAEGRYPSLLLQNVDGYMSPDDIQHASYFGTPDMPRTDTTNPLRSTFTRQFPGAAARPDGLGTVEGDKFINFFKVRADVPKKCPESEVGFTHRVTNYNELIDHFAA